MDEPSSPLQMIFTGKHFWVDVDNADSAALILG